MVISIVRTVVAPTLAGWLLQFVVLLGVEGPEAELRAAVTAGIAMAWYLGAKFLETVDPKWGSLLIVAIAPSYVETEGDRRVRDDTLLAVRRTLVPLLVGYVVSLLARQGLNVSDDMAAIALQGGITSLYYGALRWIEQRKPAAGKLLGGEAAVVY